MDDSGEIYLNFPVTLLREAFIDIRRVMDDVMNYALYRQAERLQGTRASRITQAARFLIRGITYNDPKGSYERGALLSFQLSAKVPHVGINTSIAFDFYKNPKTPDEIAVLLAYLALKSIIGSKPYIRLTNGFMLARMAGYSSTADMPDPLPQPLAGYATRRKLDKIKMKLQMNWNVNIYARNTRGFYASIGDRFTLDKLALEAEKNKVSSKQKQLRDRIDAARLMALNQLSLN